MVLTIVAVAALVATNDPVASGRGAVPEAPLGGFVVPSVPQLPELIPMPGPAFKIPVEWLRQKEIACLHAYVSRNRGKTWVLEREITTDQDSFVFRAKQPGEYWFAARVKWKNGTFDPAEMKDLTPDQRVLVATGSAEEVPATKPAVREVDELDDALTRAELELIRKEIKRLSEAKEFGSKTEEKIDRLRTRLQQARERLGGGQNIRPSGLPTAPNILFPDPLSGSGNAAPDRLQGPLGEPVIALPGRPVAPPPRAPERP